MVHVKIDLEDLTGTWRILRIDIQKNGHCFPVPQGTDVFRSRHFAESEAKTRARWYLTQNLALKEEDGITWDISPPTPAETNPTELRVLPTVE